jgi:hypothetical protein
MSKFYKRRRVILGIVVLLAFLISGCASPRSEKILLNEVKVASSNDLNIKDMRPVDTANSTDVDTSMGVGERILEKSIEPPIVDAAKHYLTEFFVSQSYMQYQSLSIELLELDVAHVKGRAAPINNPAPVPGVGVVGAILGGFFIQAIENFRTPDSVVVEALLKFDNKKIKCNGAYQVKDRTYSEAISLALRSAMYSCAVPMIPESFNPKNSNIVEGMNVIK